MLQRSTWLRGAGLLLSLGLLVLAGCTKSITAPGSGTATTTTGTPTPASGTPGAGTPTPGSGSATATPVPTGPSDWVSVIYDSTTGRANPLTIANLNPFSGNHVTTATIPVSNEGATDSISPDGQSVAYHVQNGTVNTYSVVKIDGLGGVHALGSVSNAVGNAVWENDNAHIAVAGSGQITILSVTPSAPTTIANVHAASLLGFSSDNSALFYVAAGDAPGQAPGALYRLPISNPSQAVQISPRENNSHFVLSPDGQTVYYNNTASSGSQGIYSVSASTGGTPTLARLTAGVPVGFSKSGALLYAVAQSPGVTLLQLNPGGSSDTTVVANLIGSGFSVSNLAAEIAVAPDGSSVIALAANSTGAFSLFDTPILNGGNQTTFALTGASRADLVGWDTVIIAAGS